MADDDERVNGDVDSECHAAEHELIRARQSVRDRAPAKHNKGEMNSDAQFSDHDGGSTT